MKCINCKVVNAANGMNYCSEQCLTEYMVKDILFSIKSGVKK